MGNKNNHLKEKQEFVLVFDPKRKGMVGDLVDLEEAKKLSELIDVLGRHMQNGSGKFLSHEEGVQAMRDFSASALANAQRTFLAIMSDEMGGGDDPNAKS